MKDRYVLGVLIVLLLLITESTLFHPHTFVGTHQSLYKATVPFGVYTLKGEMSGGIFGFSGSIEATEAYYLKYFDGVELKSKTLDASETSIVVDGTFTLESVYKLCSYKLLWIYQINERRFSRYIIHIPYLPDTNNTMTEDWIG